MEHTHDSSCLFWHPSFNLNVRCMVTEVGSLGFAAVGRLATETEAKAIHKWNKFSPNGPWKMRTNMVAVPLDFNL